MYNHDLPEGVAAGNEAQEKLSTRLTCAVGHLFSGAKVPVLQCQDVQHLQAIALQAWHGMSMQSMCSNRILQQLDSNSWQRIG